MRFVTLSALVLGTSMSFLPALAGGGMAKFLTPEERELYREEQMPHGRAVTPDQRQAVAAQMRQQWAAMSPADKQALKAQLDAAWSALTAAQQQAVEQRIARHVARRQPTGQQPQSQGLTMDE